MTPLLELYKQYTECTADSLQCIAGSGSNRLYYRMQGTLFPLFPSVINTSVINTSTNSVTESVIGVYGSQIKENKAFIEICRIFNECGIPAPKVLAVSEDFHCYLTDDLGNESLFFDHIANGFDEECVSLLHKTIAILPRIQFEVGKKLDFSICYPQAEFDERGIRWDLNYFKYNFLKLSPIEFDEALLEDCFDHLVKILLCDSTQTFLYRDFQSRNIMIKDGEPYFIDFQGGRKGPIYYDLVSFIFQAKANIPRQIREDLICTYLENLKAYTEVDEKDFREKLMLYALFRNLQVLGAYGYRGLIEGKAHFISSIPYAIKNLKSLLAEYEFTGIDYLISLLNELIEYHTDKTAEEIDSSKLCVDIYSFSYKKGIPADYSGNGGGFVFDCRAVHNPGRYKEYKQLTGLDKGVIDFLEEDGEMVEFMQSVYALADASVARYLERGFTHLQFSFGCTGGQHRSVYGAEHLAQHLSEKFGVQIRLNHREQKIKRIIK